MRATAKTGGEGGYSLVEVMVVTVLLGLVVTAILGIYITTQRTSSTQDGVVELQQNLRMAMGYLERDIRLAGFLNESNFPPIDTSSANTIVLNMATTTGAVGQIATGFTADAAAEAVTLRETSPFVKDDLVRIIRPSGHNLPAERILTVDSAGGTSITLIGFDAAAAAEILEGDMVAGFIDPDTDGDDNPNTPPASDTANTYIFRPNTLTYSLAAGLLQRDDMNPIQTVADGITSLQFRYLMDDGTTENTDVTGGQLEEVRAVRVSITGQSTSSEGVKSRTISSVIKLRNR